MKIRASVLIWAISLALFIGSVFLLGASLPERVATHFGASGHPNGWMIRSSYLLFSILFGIGFSSFVTGISYLARFLPPSTLNVPHSQYWRSPEHFGEACDFLFLHAFWFGTLVSVWLTALHYLIVQANRTVPVVLNSARMGALTVVFLAGTAVWAAVLIRHFAHPSK
jgi:uncharacterized membrane protein